MELDEELFEEQTEVTLKADWRRNNDLAAKLKASK